MKRPAAVLVGGPPATEANLRAGRPAVLVAPFSTERAQPSAWAATARRLPADPTMVWLHLPLDASRPAPTLIRAILAHIAR